MTQDPTAKTGSTAFQPRIREFLSTGRHFATISTIDPDGAPRQAVIWYRMDGDDLIINSLVGRRWPSNLLRDPRISIAIADRDDGYRWVGVVGTAKAIDDQAAAQADIAAMAEHYDGDDPASVEKQVLRFSAQERISFRVRAAAVHDHLD
jgi:PPOX class probable F420-dependent enzyme